MPVVRKEEERESAQLNELYTALSKAQSEMEVSKPTKLNPFFRSKYSDLPNIVKSSRPYLSKNGLSIIQRILTNSNGRMFLYTRLCHSSGQWIESNMPINPSKGDIQSIGSYITYIKRYAYSAMVGVVSSDEDDDGEAAMKEKRAQKPTVEKISKKELEELSNALKDEEKVLKSILKGYKIQKLSDLPKSQYNIVSARIKQIKEVGNE